MSLIEVLTATAIMASMMGATVVVLRSSYASWQVHEMDLERAESAHAVLRHVVRHLRQATVVTAVTASTEASGSLTLTMPSGEVLVWEHNSGDGTVMFGVGTATDLLAEDIDSLTFAPFQADGVTPATNAGSAQTIRCTVTITMPFSGATRTVSCAGWIRCW